MKWLFTRLNVGQSYKKKDKEKNKPENSTQVFLRDGIMKNWTLDVYFHQPVTHKGKEVAGTEKRKVKNGRLSCLDSDWPLFFGSFMKKHCEKAGREEKSRRREPTAAHKQGCWLGRPDPTRTTAHFWLSQLDGFRRERERSSTSPSPGGAPPAAVWKSGRLTTAASCSSLRSSSPPEHKSTTLS